MRPHSLAFHWPSHFHGSEPSWDLPDGLAAALVLSSTSPLWYGFLLITLMGGLSPLHSVSASAVPTSAAPCTTSSLCRGFQGHQPSSRVHRFELFLSCREGYLKEKTPPATSFFVNVSLFTFFMGFNLHFRLFLGSVDSLSSSLSFSWCYIPVSGWWLSEKLFSLVLTAPSSWSLLVSLSLQTFFSALLHIQFSFYWQFNFGMELYV